MGGDPLRRLIGDLIDLRGDRDRYRDDDVIRSFIDFDGEALGTIRVIEEFKRTRVPTVVDVVTASCVSVPWIDS